MRPNWDCGARQRAHGPRVWSRVLPQRLAGIGATPSIGTVGDSYDNADAQTVNGYYKADLIRGPARQGPWKTVDDVELATQGRVFWHNTSRLHSHLGDLPTVTQEPQPG